MLTSTRLSPYRAHCLVQLCTAPSTIRPDAVSHASSTWYAARTLCDASRWHRTRSARSERREGSRSSTTACVIETWTRGCCCCCGGGLVLPLLPSAAKGGDDAGTDDALEAGGAAPAPAPAPEVEAEASPRLSAAITASLLGVAPAAGGSSSSAAAPPPSKGVDGTDASSPAPAPAPLLTP